MLDAGIGGSGQQLDISELKKLFEKDKSLRVILAGGLTPNNVAQVLESLGPYRENVCGVDTSSGVETSGKQDLEKIKAFVKAAKG